MGFRLSFQGYEAKPCANLGEYGSARGRETVWRLPKQVGEGTFRHIKFASGFALYLVEYTSNKPFTMRTYTSRPKLGFGFCILGSIKGWTRGSREILTNAGQSQLLYGPDRESEITDALTDGPGNRRQLLSVSLDPDRLHSWFPEEFDSMSIGLRGIDDGTLKPGVVHSSGLTREMYMVLNQVFNPLCTDSARMLYLESKALELIAIRIESWYRNAGTCKNAHRFTVTDMNKIHDAADILAQNLPDPPTLSALSSSVGMSHVKLNQGFRMVFETTVFGYLRNVRLQQAKHFLETRQMNVTEASFAVGYNSLSAFSKAFHAQYGVKPHACTKRSAPSGFPQE